MGEELKKKLETLKSQLENTRELFIKIQGAIEFCESCIKEEKEKDVKKK